MLTIGEILAEERAKKNLTLHQVEEKIRIREKFLYALEHNDWSLFSSKVYITGIIRTYSKFLDLDVKKMLAFFRRDYEQKDDVKFKRKVSPSSLAPQTKKIATLLIIVIILLFTGYFLYQLNLFLSPPKIAILTPVKTSFIRDEKIRITGQTDKDSAVTIFGNRIFQNKDGLFIYDFPLHAGKNELVIEVTGANGKKSILKKEYVKKE